MQTLGRKVARFITIYSEVHFVYKLRLFLAFETFILILVILFSLHRVAFFKIFECNFYVMIFLSRSIKKLKVIETDTWMHTEQHLMIKKKKSKWSGSQLLLRMVD